jgi:hypothetical protein
VPPARFTLAGLSLDRRARTASKLPFDRAAENGSPTSCQRADSKINEVWLVWTCHFGEPHRFVPTPSARLVIDVDDCPYHAKITRVSGISCRGEILITAPTNRRRGC